LPGAPSADEWRACRTLGERNQRPLGGAGVELARAKEAVSGSAIISFQ